MGVFTNLSQDHLDYHHTMEDYSKAKKRLFIDLPMANDKAFAAVINADDETGARWIQEWTDQDVSLSPPFLSFGFQAGSLRGNVVNVSYEGLAIEVAYAGKTSLLQASVGGSFNLENCMAVLATLLAMGVELEAACGALMELKPAPGRFETIINPLGIGIIVDYAHTEDALQKLLSSARDLGEGRVISVFGCGGDRDRTKRPKMAYASTELADMTIFTLDNPRTEDPEQIFSDLMSGAIEGRYQRVDDRKDAIRQAIRMANKGDLVVIAGKGHETTQVIGREKFPCDDRLMAREVILEIAEAMGRGV
jgi:UDP-N-acetylmuramoyl-L-alanyl-D-glutamate--2,6-diaminopimelate ligase